MAEADSTPPSIAGARDRKKEEARIAICDAVIGLLVAGRLDLNHDAVAERTGLARRTVYRYYPDREALLSAAADRVRELAGPRVIFPETEADLTGTVHATYTGFDRIAPIVTLMRSTPQGRALRKANYKVRQESYRKVTADAVKALPPADRDIATAMLQVLHTSIWLEMHDHWDFTGEQIARAAGWAIRTLLKDLRERGDRPLDE